MKISDIKPSQGSRKNKKRVGRGIGSGHGKTSCKGHKGQKARSGSGKGAGFEGGQMPLQRRLPKRGFKNVNTKKYAEVNLSDFANVKGTDIITPELLREKRIVKKLENGIKVLGGGEIKKPLTIKANAFSSSAAKKIAAAGGKAEVI